MTARPRHFAGGACFLLHHSFAVPYLRKPDPSKDAHTIAGIPQEKRHLADYDPGQQFRRSDVLALIRDIEDAMSSFSKVQNLPETKFFLVSLLAWKTLVNR